MPHEVIITTGSRLHWGLLSIAPLTGREFGGVGLMVDEPRLVLSAKVSPEKKDSIICHQKYESRIASLINAACSHASGSSRQQYYSIELHSEIPLHCGFGSGTQLSLAVARAISFLTDEQPRSSVELAHRVHRGSRSALGIHGFDFGGFLVEAGKHASDEISPMITRHDFPEDWKVLLITPNDQAGISGSVEADSIQKLGSMPVSITEKLCRLALMQLIPSVMTQDYANFSSGLTEFGRTVGEFFMPVQGGIFAHPQMVELEKLLTAEGVQGIAQTSWGPTLSIVCQNSKDAENVSSIITKNGYGEFCAIRTVSPMNCGAQIQIKHAE